MTSTVWMLPSSSHRLTCVTPAFLAEICTCVGRQRRHGQQLRIVDLHARNVLVQREDAAGVGRQLELLAHAR